MNNNKHRYILGAVEKKSRDAVMEFYGEVDYWSAIHFIDEFKYLEQLGIKNLTIRINSVGGNVHEGMSIYNTIMNSSMHITTINESVAMSMGSIIWSAGDEVKMRDIAILMLHKPYISSIDEADKDTQAYIDSMDFQLRNIYSKRFGLSDEVVNEIMTGEEGIDGTYFTAQEAVDAGFLKSENIIETPPIVKDEYSSILSIKNHKEYAYAIAKVNFNDSVTETDIEKQLQDSKNTINNQTTKKKNMEDVKLIASHLELPKEASIVDVTSKIMALNKLKGTNDELTASLDISNKLAVELQNKLDEKSAELVAAKTSEENLQKNYDALQAKLEKYVEAEREAVEAEVTELIEEAVKAGKLNEESKEAFIEIAKANIEQAKKLIAGITPAQKPEKLTDAIGKDAKNIQEAGEAQKLESKKLSERIMASKGLK